MNTYKVYVCNSPEVFTIKADRFCNADDLSVEFTTGGDIVALIARQSLLAVVKE